MALFKHVETMATMVSQDSVQGQSMTHRLQVTAVEPHADAQCGTFNVHLLHTQHDLHTYHRACLMQGLQAQHATPRARADLVFSGQALPMQLLPCIAVSMRRPALTAPEPLTPCQVAVDANATKQLISEHIVCRWWWRRALPAFRAMASLSLAASLWLVS